MKNESREGYIDIGTQYLGVEGSVDEVDPDSSFWDSDGGARIQLLGTKFQMYIEIQTMAESKRSERRWN